MKSIFNRLIGCVAVVATLVMSACTTGDTTEADNTFAGFAEQPEQIVGVVGENCTISFTPAYSWKLSLTGSDSDFFEVVNEERLDRKTIMGEASTTPVEVVVKVPAELNFERDYVCNVELRMNGKDKVIAAICVAKAERTLELYLAEVSEVNGSKGYNYSEDAESPFLYVYETQPLTADRAIELILGESRSFEHRILVKTNFNWVTSAPSWLSLLVTEGAAGYTELKLSGQSQPESVAGVLSFRDAANQDVEGGSVKVVMETLGTLYPSSLVESATWSMTAEDWTFSEFPTAEFAYTLQYTTTTDGDNSSFICAQRPYTISCHTYDINGSLYDITTNEEAWLTATEQSDGSFSVKMDATKSTALRNEVSGIYEGFVAFKNASGKVFTFIHCKYNPAPAAPVAFYLPGGAESDGSTLVEITEGAEYDAYASYGAPIYKLTFTNEFPSMSMLKGLPQEWQRLNEEDASWLAYEYSEESQVVTMNKKANGSTGALLFTNGGANHCVLICHLNIAE